MPVKLGRFTFPAMVAALVWAIAATASAQSAKLTLLHVNDVYEISAKGGKGGLAELMTLLRQERARADNHLTTLGGDLISPSVMSGLTKGKQMIELMNALRFDVAGFGNHEFDFGSAVLRERIAASEFTWLASNTVGFNGKPFGGAQATMLQRVGDLTVGLFSVITPETEHLSSPDGGVTFTPVMDAASAAVESLKEQGADFIIALTHLDIAQDRELAHSVKGINVILGGHDHDPITFYEGDTLILKAGYDAHYLAVADLLIEKKEGRRGITVSMLPQWRLISTSGVTPDPEIAALIKSYEGALDSVLNVAVGKTAVELDSRRATVRTMESNIGNFIADAMRAGVGADVGLTNGGGIRGDRTYKPGTTLSRKDVLTELPFGNVVVLIELSGADLLAAVENGVGRVEDKAGRFPQVSGMSFVFDPKKGKGDRVVDIKVGGQPLDEAKMYKVATNDFMYGGGDGYVSLTKGKALVDASGATLMASIVMDYLAGRGTISPKVEGRITEYKVAPAVAAPAAPAPAAPAPAAAPKKKEETTIPEAVDALKRLFQ